MGFLECSHGRVLFVWIDGEGPSGLSAVLRILGSQRAVNVYKGH